MKIIDLILILFVCTLIGCKGGDGGSDEDPPSARPSISPAVDSGVVGLPTVTEKAYYAYNEALGQCLNQFGESGYNKQTQEQNAQCVDFSDQDLTGRNLSNFDLRGANFENAILVGVVLDGSRLLGVRINGAEVGSEYLLQWLITGTKPLVDISQPIPSAEEASSPVENSNNEVSDTDEEESIVVTDPLTVESNLIAVKINLPHFDEFDQAEDLNLYFSDIKKESDLSSMESQISLYSQRLIKYTGQAKIRMQKALLVENNLEIQTASTLGQADVLVGLKEKRVLLQQSIGALREDMAVQNQSITSASTDYKEERLLNSRASQISKISDRLLKMGSNINSELSTLQDYDQILIDLEKSEAVKISSIESINSSMALLKTQITAIDLKISPINEEIKLLSAKISDFNQQIKSVKEQLLVTTDDELKQKLLAQKAALYEERAPIVVSRNLLREQIVPLREERSEPALELKSLVQDRRQAQLELKEIRTQIQENKLLTRLVVLLEG